MSLRRIAAARPPIPAPTTATRFARGRAVLEIFGLVVAKNIRLSIDIAPDKGYIGIYAGDASRDQQPTG
jgi:hypothetical protein